MSQMNELYDALRVADKAGRTEDVARLSAYIRDLEKQGDDSVSDEDAKKAHDDEVYRMSTEGMSTLDKGLVGAGRTTATAIEGVKDLYYRATGQDDKVAELNAQADDDAAQYKILADRSTAAKVGEMAGEVGLGIATGVGVGGVYKGVKAAEAAGSISKLGAIGRTTGMIAAEGAAFEGVRNRGDALDRLIDAGEGAAMNLAGQGILTATGKAIGATGRRFATRLGRKAFDESIDTIEDGMRLKKEAALQDGGYVLDDVDAAVDRAGLARRDALRREMSPEGVALQNRHAAAEMGVTSKAESLIDDAVNGGQRTSLNARTDSFATGLRELRADDWKGVDNAYDAWRSAPESANALMDTKAISKPINDLLEETKITADGGVHKKLNDLLGHYGVIGKKGKMNPMGDVKADADGVLQYVKTTETLPSPKPLTAANYEQLVIDINGLYSNNNNVASKRLIGAVRNLLEESKYEMLAKAPGASEEAIALGEAARSSRKAFAAKWEQGDIVDKLTSLRPGTDEYRSQPVDAVRALMNPSNLDKLKKVQKIIGLSAKPEHKQFLADIQAAPLFDAMDKALKGQKTAAGGVPLFSDRQFSQTIRKYSDDQLETLYGKDFVSKLGKAEKAWKLREAQPNWQSNQNPSGTAESARHFAAAGIRIASTRGAGSDTLAVIPMLSGVREVLAKRATTKDLKLLLSGKLPQVSKDIREETFKKIIKEGYPNPQFAQFDSVFAAMARELSRSYENKEFDN